MTRHRALLAVLAVYALLALGYNLALPVGEAPDEATHAEYVRYLLRNGALPQPISVSGEADDGRGGITQGGHPPLFYALAAAAVSGLDWERPLLIANPHFSFNRERAVVPNAFVHGEDLAWPYAASAGVMALHAMRLVSFVAGLVLISATYLIGRAVWPGDPSLAWGAAAIAGFLPGLLFMSAAVNNDALAAAMAASVVLGVVRTAQGRAGGRELVGWGGVLGLALLTKMTALFLAPLMAIALVANAYRARAYARAAPGSAGPPVEDEGRAIAGGWRGLWRGAAAIALGTLLVAGWWFVRSARLYGAADPLGWSAFQRAGIGFARHIPLSSDLDSYWRTQFETFVGVFGWSAVPLPGIVYVAAAALFLVAIAGLLIVLVRWRRLEPDTRWGLVMLAAAVALAYAATLRLGLAMDLSVAHGRYLYVVLGPLAVLFVTGLAAPLPPRWRAWACGALAIGLAALSTYSLIRVLVPAFAPPEVVSAQAVAAIAHRADVDFGGRVRLVGYALQDTPLRAGDTTTVVLYWTGLPGNRRSEFQSDTGRTWDVPVVVEPELVFVHLVDGEGDVVARVDEAPFEGRMPVNAWRPGTVFKQTVMLPVGEGAAAGEGAIRIGIYPEGRADEPLTAASGAEELGGSYWIRPVRITAGP
jgi:hypothetical protein